MSKNFSVESQGGSSPDLSINPMLQAALSSLDVQLEEELARYRRQRTGRPVMPSRGLGRHQTRKPIELISVEKAGNQTQRPALGMSTAAPLNFPLFMVNQSPTDEATQQTNHEQAAQPRQLDISSELSPGLVASSPNNLDENLGSQHDPTKQRPEPEQSPPAVKGDLATIAAPQSQPEDYLESSEQLLRSLGDEETSTKPQKHFTAKLLTPLGVGSILLLLLSGATAIYVLGNPSSFSAIGFDRFFGSKTPTTAQSPTAATATDSDVAKDSPIPNGPDMASEEFPDVNLKNLPHLEASPKPSPSASPVQVPPIPALPNSGVMTAPSVVPNSAIPRRSSDLSSLLLPPSPPPMGTLRATTVPPVAPLPKPATATPKTSAAKTSTANPASAKSNQSKPSKSASAKSTAKKKTPAPPTPATVAANPVNNDPGGYYFVLINSTSESALEQARTIVPDAYVETFPQGARIQMGAFKTEPEAKALIEQLQRQGISASTYQPKP